MRSPLPFLTTLTLLAQALPQAPNPILPRAITRILGLPVHVDPTHSAAAEVVITWGGLKFTKIPLKTTTTTTLGGGAITSTHLITVTATPPPVEPTTTTTIITLDGPAFTAMAKRDEQAEEEEEEEDLTTTQLPVSREIEEAQPTILVQITARKNTTPLAGNTKDLPSPGDLWICKAPNFTGECKWLHSTTFKCHNMPASLVLNAASVKPAQGQTCVFYDEWDCGGNGLGPAGKTLFINSDSGINDMAASVLGMNFLSWDCADRDCEGVQSEGGCWEDKVGNAKPKGSKIVWGLEGFAGHPKV
jgi:hypothetical protein